MALVQTDNRQTLANFRIAMYCILTKGPMTGIIIFIHDGIDTISKSIHAYSNYISIKHI